MNGLNGASPSCARVNGVLKWMLASNGTGAVRPHFITVFIIEQGNAAPVLVSGVTLFEKMKTASLWPVSTGNATGA